MSKWTETFYRLKTSIGGNREKAGFEYTFGLPEEERNGITPPGRRNRRILAELEYALHLSDANAGIYETELGEALLFLTGALERDGVLTDTACRRAEEMLAPLAPLAKSYQLILTGHAHIDMNWMWSYQETVATTLATFRTMCDLMDEYPEFTFTQSQASVYKIAEEYDPELAKRIRQRIAEGRWEVAATSWVETDKNMPSGESLLRHIEETRDYLRDHWGVKDFDLDFVPDTFGHAVTIPEIDAFAGVRYMYHCRGNARSDLLYRYRAPSGREILVLREANWYNAAITPQMASGLMEVVRHSSGLKTGMVVYGVGDHGGGPTRRDVERAMDMMTWPIYPTIRFGGLRDYFHEAEKIRNALPVVTEEMNYFAPGCYTTQSRIKRGNRRAEAALYDTETLAAMAEARTDYRLPRGQLSEAWRNVLFTHFHDILTGSCVQDSREYAMGLYQRTAAVTHTQTEKAATSLARAVDTASMIAVRAMGPGEGADAAKYNSQSEGAGVGYGVAHFAGTPAPERGSGLMRIAHFFNTLPCPRDTVAEWTVWDWPGDLSRVMIQDSQGVELPCQVVDQKMQKYWDHRYFRVLTRLTVPAMGYATVVLRQREASAYPVYLQRAAEQVSRFYDDIVLDNGELRAVIDATTGRLRSLTDLAGCEMLKEGETAGLYLLDTERRTSSAWDIGRTLAERPVDRCVELTRTEQGALRQGVKATWRLEGGCRAPSVIEATYALEAGSRALRVDLRADWQEQGGDTIPVLVWRTPVARANGIFRYLIPAGSQIRPALNNDVPGIGGGAALRTDKRALQVISDSKYGYRGSSEALDLTLINSAVNPDPYPERGVHVITLWLGVGKDTAQSLQQAVDTANHPLISCSGTVHKGTLPTVGGLLELVSGTAAITSVRMRDGALLVRGYETSGQYGEARLRLNLPVKSAQVTDLTEEVKKGPARVEGQARIETRDVVVPMKGAAIWSVLIQLGN